MEPERVLLTVYLPTHFRELTRVAQVLKRSGRFEPVIWLARTFPTLPEAAARCQRDGVTCFDPEGHLLNADSAGHLGHSSGLPNHNSNHWTDRVLAKLASSFGQYAVQQKITARLLARIRPSLVILAEENVGYATEIVTQAARKIPAPTLVVPYTLAAPSEAAEALCRNRRVQVNTFARRLFARRYPQWVYEHKGMKLLRLSLKHAWAMQWLGLAPANPWILNHGSAEALAVESKAMWSYHRKLGLPESKLVQTGSLADDTLAAGLRESVPRRRALCQELGLAPDKPLFLCALPPNQLNKPRPQCVFSNYESLIQFWLECLQQVPGVNRVLALHPSSRPEEFQMAERYGCKIASWDTAELIPLCDGYIASVSATIRWAIACGKPVLNYDVYAYGYADFGEVAGVLTLAEKDAFQQTLKRLAEDETFLREITARQALHRQDWGCLDGQAGTRLLKLCDELIAGSALCPKKP